MYLMWDMRERGDLKMTSKFLTCTVGKTEL